MDYTFISEGHINPLPCLKPFETTDFCVQTDPLDEYSKAPSSSTLNIFYCSVYFNQEVSTFCDLAWDDNCSINGYNNAATETTESYIDGDNDVSLDTSYEQRPLSDREISVTKETNNENIKVKLERDEEEPKTTGDVPQIKAEVIWRTPEDTEYQPPEEELEYDDDDDQDYQPDEPIKKSQRKPKRRRRLKIKYARPIKIQEGESDDDNSENEKIHINEWVEVSVKGKKRKKNGDESRTFQCRSCATVVDGVKELIEHMRTEHRPTKVSFNCNKCSEGFRLAYLLQRHKEIVHEEKSNIDCGFCTEAFTNTDAYMNHVKTVHNTTVKKNSHVKITIPEHLKANGPPYICDECGKSKKTPTSFWNHKRSHNRPYKCNQCPKSFPFKSALLLHQSYHSGDRPYGCDECDHSFPNSVALKTHKKQVHSVDGKNKPKKDLIFQCDQCPKKFPYKCSLELHKTYHSGERPFSCEICNHAFPNRAALNSHKKTVHFAIRPKCPICDKALGCKAKLDTHMRMHTGEKPYNCNVCGAKFTQKGNMKAHISSVHGTYMESVKSDGSKEVKLVKYKRPPRKPSNNNPRPNIPQHTPDPPYMNYSSNEGFPNMAELASTSQYNPPFLNMFHANKY